MINLHKTKAKPKNKITKNLIYFKSTSNIIFHKLRSQTTLEHFQELKISIFVNSKHFDVFYFRNLFIALQYFFRVTSVSKGNTVKIGNSTRCCDS